MTNDLLPCPFCGGIARIAKDFNDGEIVYCENEDCHVRPELNGYHEPETAIEMWNSRVSTPNKPAEVDLDADITLVMQGLMGTGGQACVAMSALRRIEKHLATGKGVK